MSDLKRSLIKRLLPSPSEVNHFEYSMLYSMEDAPKSPFSQRLLDLSLKVAANVPQIDLKNLRTRMKPPYFVDVWPGEHYLLLASLVQVMQPKVVIEIGTYRGLSALALKKYLPKDGKVVTFDVLDWRTISESSLKKEDFEDGHLSQILADLCDPKAIEHHRALLESADLIFIDAAKDGRMERVFLENFRALNFKNNPVMVFDDTRIWNMLKIWREIRWPKLDITSFGHWTGTGLVEWQKGENPF